MDTLQLSMLFSSPFLGCQVRARTDQLLVDLNAASANCQQLQLARDTLEEEVETISSALEAAEVTANSQMERVRELEGQLAESLAAEQDLRESLGSLRTERRATSVSNEVGT